MFGRHMAERDVAALQREIQISTIWLLHSTNNTSCLCWRLEGSWEGLRWSRLLVALASFLVRAQVGRRVSVASATL